MKTRIEPITPTHLEAIWQIEQQAHSHPWAKSMIDDLGSRGAFHHVLLKDEMVVGYFYAQNIVGEVTLLNLAIDPIAQGEGLGRLVMEHLLSVCEHAKAESIWLEVRESNHKARSLYESLGFNEVDRRRDYYPSPKGKEDAIIMSYLLFY